VGGYAWYRHDRELRAADAYAGVQERLAEEAEKIAKAAGEEGNIDEEKLLAKTTTELENLVERFGDTGTGRAATYELASLYFDRGDYEKARDLFSKVEAKSKGLEKVLAGVGVADCEKATGNYDAAIAKYRVIFDNHRGEFPSVPVAMNLAECYRETGKLDEAANTYRYVLDYHRLSPYAPEAERGLSEAEALMAGKAGTL
jgi:tetratricopeptide (TPR) repeat protein